jgi:hypothetical protein
VPSTNKKGEILSNLSLSETSEKNYFFFLTAFLTAFLAGAFFLVAMENHPLFKSRVWRKIA